MLEILRRRFALSEKGAKDFCRGVLFTVMLDLALMLPAAYIFFFLDELLGPGPGDVMFSGHTVLQWSLTGLGVMLLMFAVAVLQYRSTYASVYEESAVRRISLAEKLRRLPLSFFGTKNASDLTSTIMDDCTDLEHTFSHAVPQLIASLISIVLITIGMCIYNWQLSLALFWVVPVAFAVVFFSRKRYHARHVEYYGTRRAVIERIQEGLDTVQEIKSHGQENDYIRQLDADVDRNEAVQTRGELMTGIMVNGLQSILKLGLASAVLAGAGMLAAGTTDVFTYIIFVVIGSRIYSPINEVLNNLAALFYLDVRIDRVNEMESLPVQQGSTDFTPQGYDIVFDRVTFSYEDGKTVLKDVSFVARQGEVTALVGPSGCGKSTVARLAARFWDAQGGRITLGGIDIGGVDPETLLRSYSVVFQDVVLFNATVMDNIRIGRRDASDDEVLEAARTARCEEFVAKLPQGWNTVIGENGDTLSGGERQRISIARALLKDAPIVLLDEATASLDVENETLIQSAISQLVKDKTVIVIAHRTRTVYDADRIVVLSDGTVAETGTPEELERRGGIFAGMLARQSVSSDLAESR